MRQVQALSLLLPVEIHKIIKSINNQDLLLQELAVIQELQAWSSLDKRKSVKFEFCKKGGAVLGIIRGVATGISGALTPVNGNPGTAPGG